VSLSLAERVASKPIEEIHTWIAELEKEMGQKAQEILAQLSLKPWWFVGRPEQFEPRLSGWSNRC
jgi:Txe/YoeB family toxin of Txe-Axe toxin-antitoxin module